jgi:hypothetical protein
MPVLPPRPTATMSVLSARVLVRLAVLQPGRTISTARPINLEALLSQLVSQVNAPRCAHNMRGSGVWSACVLVPSFFGRSCTNCHYSSEGTCCSLCKFSPRLFLIYNSCF